MPGRERAARESQHPAQQFAALATRVSTTRAARRIRPASAASAAWPSCVSVYERRTRPSTFSSSPASTKPDSVSRSSEPKSVPVLSRTSPPESSAARLMIA
jgi:hypothetical protein